MAEKNKGTYDKEYYENHREQHIQNVMKYNEKQAAIHIRMKQETMARFKDAAAKAGMSLRGFIMEAVEEKIERNE